MPNTPAAIGRGITVAVGNRRVTAKARKLAHGLLAATGAVEWVDDEALMDAVTAVSGSGPAYVFLLAEAMAQAGAAAGLPAALAEKLARETVAGSGELLHRSPLDAATLRQNVTSPGGTTAAALEVLMGSDGVAPLMTKAVAAATKRGKDWRAELGPAPWNGPVRGTKFDVSAIRASGGVSWPARQPVPKPAAHAARRQAAAPTGTPRERIIDAFMALLAEQPIERIGLAEIAERAGVTLAELRGEFGSPLAILAAHVKELDRKVLAEVDPDMDGGIAARAAVRRADAPARTARRRTRRRCARCCARRGAIRRWRWRSTPWRCARSNGC